MQSTLEYRNNRYHVGDRGLHCGDTVTLSDGDLVVTGRMEYRHADDTWVLVANDGAVYYPYVGVAVLEAE